MCQLFGSRWDCSLRCSKKNLFIRLSFGFATDWVQNLIAFHVTAKQFIWFTRNLNFPLVSTLPVVWPVKGRASFRYWLVSYVSYQLYKASTKEMITENSIYRISYEYILYAHLWFGLASILPGNGCNTVSFINLIKSVKLCLKVNLPDLRILAARLVGGCLTFLNICLLFNRRWTSVHQCTWARK